jgi:glycosyltransferase involved in cell wall biosynthesis
VRVLIDYRPALRERSGVGEYTHRLVQALAQIGTPQTEPALDLTVFSSSWKDRLDPRRLPDGVAHVDRRVPVRWLNFAWHRLGWPPADWLAGRAFDVTHSPHPLILPARRAAHVVTIHDLNFLAHPERTRAEIRRDYPALARLHAHRADRIVVVSEFTAGEVVRQLGVPREKIAVCPPGAPAWEPRSSSERSSRARIWARCSTRTNG